MGFLGMAIRVVGLPLTMIGQGVAQVYLAEASALARVDRASMSRLLRRSLRRLALIGVIPGVVIVLAGPQLFSLILGPGWREAGELARLLAPSLLLQFIAVPVSQTLTILERQGAQLGWDISRLVLVCILPLTVHLAGGDLRATVGAYSAALAVCYLVLLWLSDRACMTARDDGSA